MFDLMMGRGDRFSARP